MANLAFCMFAGTPARVGKSNHRTANTPQPVLSGTPHADAYFCHLQYGCITIPSGTRGRTLAAQQRRPVSL